MGFRAAAKHSSQAVRTVDPDATGKPFTTLEGLKAMRDGFLWAAVYALIAMVLVSAPGFRQNKQTLVALLPLALGMIATLGVMSLFGFPLNPANMIALPADPRRRRRQRRSRPARFP